MVACLWRYKVKVLPAHLPWDWMMSKSIPWRRYSSVPSICRLWPLRLGKLNWSASLLTLVVTSFLLNGQCFPLGWVQVKRCSLGVMVLTQRWLLRAAMGSEGSICLAHWMDSPWPDDFNILVHGRWNLVTLSPFLLVMHDIPALVMCFAGSNALMLGMVNLPTLATPQKQTTRHAKKAVSRGLLRSSWDLKRERVSGVKGSCWGHLKEGEARQVAPSMIALPGGWVYVPWPPV